MRIGIDFDNTIANYDEFFCKVAFNNKLIKKDWSGNKQALRKKIKACSGSTRRQFLLPFC